MNRFISRLSSCVVPAVGLLLLSIVGCETPTEFRISLEINRDDEALVREHTVTRPETVELVAGVSVPTEFQVDEVQFLKDGAPQLPAMAEPSAGGGAYQLYLRDWPVAGPDAGRTTWTAVVHYRDPNGQPRALTSNAVTVTVNIGTSTGNPSATDSSLVGFIPAAGTARNVSIQGDYAYVTSDEFGLSIIDISDPSAPVGVGATIPSFMGYDVAVEGTTAVVTDHESLRVIDVTDPTAPQTLAVVPDVGKGLALSGGFAYARRFSKMVVVDVRNPSAPSVIGETERLPAVLEIKVVGTRAYVAAGSEFRIFDISTPSSPTPLGSASVPSGGTSLAVHGNYAYLGNQQINVYNVSNPSNPSHIASVPVSATDLAISGNRLYVAIQSTFRIYDVSTPAEPVWIGSGDGFNHQGLAVDGNVAFLASASPRGDGGFYIVDVQSAASPTVLGHVPSIVVVQGIAAQGTLAVVTSLDRLTVVDTSDPTRPRAIGFLEGNMRGAAMSGQYAYVRLGTRLVTVDLSVPTSPRFVGEEIFLPGGAEVKVQGAFAYVTAGSTLRVFDLSAPTAPSEIGSVSIPNGAGSLAVVGDYAYVGNYYYTHIVDISNPSNPAIIGSTPGGASGVAAKDGFLYIASQGSFRVVDVSNPAAPVVLITSEGFGAQAIGVVGDRAYLGTSAEGVVIYDVSNPSAPVVEEQVFVPGSVPAIATDGNYVFAADSASTIDIFWSGP